MRRPLLLPSLRSRWRAARAVSRLVALAVVLPVAALTTGGCHEPLDPVPRPLPVVAADQHVAQLVVMAGPTPDTWTVHATLTGGVAAPRVGGFRARLVLPAALAVDGEVSDQRGAEGAMVRAVRQDGATVHAAGAAAEGMAAGDLFVVTVRGGREALAQLRLELEELVDVRGTDRRGRVVVSPRVDDRRIRR